MIWTRIPEKSAAQSWRSALRLLSLAVVLLAAALAPCNGWTANFYQGVATNNLFWPGGVIPYQFDTNITAAEQAVYLAGMREWELAANVHFVPYTNQSQHVILRFDYQQGTNTYVASSPPVLTVDTLSRAQVGHETGHLLGFQHEHVRTNRDTYITVNFTNLISNGSTNGGGEQGGGGIAGLYLVDSNSVPNGAYDFESVMHYGRTLFSIDPNHLDVLVPKPPYLLKYYYRIGNLALSVGDRAGAAYLYGPPTTALTNVVTNTADVGFGTLRAALYYANDHPGTTVRFSIPATDPGFSNGVYTIYLSGELPPLVADGTVVDAATQPGFAGKPIVALDGSRLIPELAYSNVLFLGGLHLYAANCVVRGLAFNSFPDTGLYLQYPFSLSNHVEGCFVGLAPSGTNAAGNTYEGITIQLGASYNTIGGLNATQRNVISGNGVEGLIIEDTNTTGTVVLGNYLGIDVTGTRRLPNGDAGVYVWNCSGVTIGGTNSGAGNVISGNWSDAIALDGGGNIVVQGNYLGTDFTGSTVISNGGSGIDAYNGAQGVTLGGAGAAARNVISGNAGLGIIAQGPGTANLGIFGNFIGLDGTGSFALPNATGLGLYGDVRNTTIGGTNSLARNFISGNRGDGIDLGNGLVSPTTILGNYIGVATNGTTPVGNGGDGIYFFNGPQTNTIGGTVPGAGNLIGGNHGDAIALVGPGTGYNLIQGNLVGTTKTGSNPLPNGGSGVSMFGGTAFNEIGGTTASARNILSAGTNGDGVFLGDPGSSNNVVQGNYIGTDINGTQPFGNSGAGVFIGFGASSNLVGGTQAGAGNLVSANGGDGIQLYGPGTSYNLVQGNFVGTDKTGSNPLGNGASALSLISGPQFNTIGGTSVAARNLLAASTNYDGVYLYGATNNTVQGNYIGTDVSGLMPFANGGIGLTLFGASRNNQIGGAAAGAGNVIAASAAQGIFIADPDTGGNVIQGNSIGVGSDGIAPLGNGQQGILIDNGASSNVIGLTLAGAGVGNLIANSAWEGIALYDTNTVGNTLRGNAIFNNGRLGVNLVGGNEDGFGVTANHPGGPVSGPNDLQNYPILNASAYPGTTVVGGQITGAANRTYLIDLYWNSTADPSGHGQGQIYLGSTLLGTDADSNGSFWFATTSNLLGGTFTATATDAFTGDTSEFSTDVPATKGPPQLVGPLVKGSNGFSFSVLLQTNTSYHVQATTNLGAQPVVWSNLASFVATASPLPFTDHTATNLPERFYRVVSP